MVLGLIKKYNELVKRIGKLELAIQEIAKEVEMLKNKISTVVGTKHYSMIFGFKSQEDFEKMVNVCIDIAKKDSTFVFSADPVNIAVYLFGIDADDLHKKSMWLINKVGIEGLKYKVY